MLAGQGRARWVDRGCLGASGAIVEHAATLPEQRRAVKLFFLGYPKNPRERFALDLQALAGTPAGASPPSAPNKQLNNPRRQKFARKCRAPAKFTLTH